MVENIINIDKNLLDLFEFTLSKGDSKKIQITKACITSISTNGIEKTSFESVSKLVGTNRSHIKYYYNTKEELLVDCYKYIIGTYQSYSLKSLSKTKGDKKMLDSYLDGYFAWAKQNSDQVSAMLLLYYQCTYKNQFQEINQAIKIGGAKKIQFILRNNLKLNISKAKSEMLSRAIQAILSASIIDSYTFKAKDVIFDQKEKEARKVIKLLLKNSEGK